MLECDYLVIGGGQSGIILARELARFQHNVTLIEEQEIGGSFIHTIEVPRHQFVTEYQQQTTLSKAVSRQIVNAVKKHHKDLLQELKTYKKLTIVQGKAEFVSKNLVEINSAKERHLITFKQCIITAGKDEFIKPAIKGIDKVPFLYSRDIFLTKEIPHQLAILGISCHSLEIACFFADLGVQVSLYNYPNCPNTSLQYVDKTVLNTLFDRIKTKGAIINEATQIVSVQKAKSGIILKSKDNQIFNASHLYLDTVRNFNGKELELTKIGVSYTKKGIVTTKTGKIANVPHIHAFGDCNSMVNPGNKFALIDMFLEKQHKNPDLKNPSRFQVKFPVPTIPDLSTVPYISGFDRTIIGSKTRVSHVYGKYPIVTIGQTEYEAISKYGPNAKVLIQPDSLKDSVLKIVYKDSNKEILGVSLAGEYTHLFEAFSLLALEKNLLLNEYLDLKKVISNTLL